MSVTFDTSEVTALARDIRANAFRATPRVRRVVTQAGHDVVDGFHARVPVRTGRDRASATVEETGPLGFEAGPHTSYDAYVELGTSRQAPEPALGPAFDAVEPEAVRAILDIASEILFREP